jgi:hypothetical protein
MLSLSDSSSIVIRSSVTVFATGSVLYTPQNVPYGMGGFHGFHMESIWTIPNGIHGLFNDGVVHGFQMEFRQNGQ